MATEERWPQVVEALLTEEQLDAPLPILGGKTVPGTEAPADGDAPLCRVCRKPMGDVCWECA